MTIGAGDRRVQYKTIYFDEIGYHPTSSAYKPKGFRKMENVWYSPDGSPYIRMVPGFTSLGTLAGGATVQSLGHFNCGLGRATYFLADDDDLYEVESDESLTSRQTMTTTTFANDGKLVGYGYSKSSTDDSAYVFLGTATPNETKIDMSAGTSDTVGLTRPDVSSATSTTNGSGAVRGVVKYFLSWSDTDGLTEGALSLEFGEIDAGDGSTITVGNGNTIPEHPSQASKKRLYRTFSDGSQPFFLATLDDGTLTYEDNIADVDLGDLPLFHGDTPPADVRDAVFHYGRGYLLVTPDIYWSDPAEPESWYTATNGNSLNLQSGDYPRALARVPSGILVFMNNKVHLLSGRSPSQFRVDEITPDGGDGLAHGALSPRQVVTTPKGVFYFHNQSKSVYHYFGGNSAQKISGPIESDLKAIQSRVNNTIHEWLSLHWLVDNKLVALSFGHRATRTDDITNENNTWFYDPEVGRWVGKAGYGFHTMASWAKAGTGTSLENPNYSNVAFGYNETATDIYHFLTGVNHNGSAITPVLGLPTFTADAPHLEKTLLFVDVLCKPVASETIQVDWFIDGATSSDGNATITLVGTDGRERHRVNIGERGREFDIDLTLDDATGNSGVYGVVFGFTVDTSIVGS